MHNFSRAELSETRQSQKLDNMVQLTTEKRGSVVYVLCTKSGSVFVYPWEYTVMKFAANLNLKEHQFFFTHPVLLGHSNSEQ